MQLLVLIPAVLIFLYSLYRLVKDDYVFIRKGVSLEQSFDIAFETLWISLFFSRLFYLITHFVSLKYLFLQFFSIQHGGFSLTGTIVGGVVALYMISKSRKIPFGRLGDFFSLSLLYALPAGFLLVSPFYRNNDLLFTFLYALLYFLMLLFSSW